MTNLHSTDSADSFPSELVAVRRRLLERAQLHREMAGGTIAATFVLIFFGIGLFAFGEDLVRSVYPTREAQLLSRLDALDRDERTSSKKEKEAKVDLLILERTQALWLVMVNLRDNLNAARSEPDDTNLKHLMASLESAMAVLDGIAEKKSNKAFATDTEASATFPPQVWQKVEWFCVREEVDVAATKECVGEIRKWAQQVSESQEKANPPDCKASLTNVINAVSYAIAKELRKARDARQAYDLQELDRETDKERRETERKRIEAELEEIQRQKDKVLFMAWIPDLTIRLGIVVLLLYLTGVCLNTYRYTLAMAAFYEARADSLDLVTADSLSSPSVVDRLSTIVKDFSPTAAVDGVRVPYEALAEPLESALRSARG